jgi:hypothetical protein
MEALIVLGGLWFIGYQVDKNKITHRKLAQTITNPNKNMATNFQEGQLYFYQNDLKRMKNEVWSPQQAREEWGIPFLGDPEVFNRKHDEGTETYNLRLMPLSRSVIPEYPKF